MLKATRLSMVNLRKFINPSKQIFSTKASLARATKIIASFLYWYIREYTNKESLYYPLARK